MVDIILVAILAAIVGFAGWYVYKAKKSGRKCIGCPDGCSCGTKESGESCSCDCGGESKTCDCGCGGKE